MTSANEIGKSRRCEQPADLSRKIARPENAAKKILAIAFVVIVSVMLNLLVLAVETRSERE